MGTACAGQLERDRQGAGGTPTCVAGQAQEPREQRAKEAGRELGAGGPGSRRASLETGEHGDHTQRGLSGCPSPPASGGAAG